MARSLSGEALKKIPAELEAKEKALEAKEEALKVKEEEISDQMAKNLVKLKAMELDLKERCAALDDKELEAGNNIKQWQKLQGLTDSADSFSQFYECINKMYVIWTSAGGDDSKMFESIKKIIEARRELN